MTRRRLRRWGKWAGLGATALLVTVTIVSATWGAAIVWPGCTVAIAYGNLVVVVPGSPAQRAAGLAFHGPERHGWPFRWWFSWEPGPGGRVLGMPLWPACVAGAAWTGVAWVRASRLRDPGCCRRCGYDLAGLAAGTPCPECGQGPR